MVHRDCHQSQIIGKGLPWRTVRPTPRSVQGRTDERFRRDEESNSDYTIVYSLPAPPAPPPRRSRPANCQTPDGSPELSPGSQGRTPST
jgi:hypothetical protein